MWALRRKALALTRAGMLCDSWSSHGQATTAIIATHGQPLLVYFLNSSLIVNSKITSCVLIRTFLAFWLWSCWMFLWKLNAKFVLYYSSSWLPPKKKKRKGKKNSGSPYKWSITYVLVFESGGEEEDQKIQILLGTEYFYQWLYSQITHFSSLQPSISCCSSFPR